MNEERLANALGWFSIGLGLAEIAAPRRVARLIGVSDDDESRSVLRRVGMREIASGVGILSRPKPAGWLWTRVAGDVMDLALLGSAFRSDDAQKNRVAVATTAVVGVTALDLLCSTQLTREVTTAVGRGREHEVQVRTAITINRSPEEVYRFWHDFQNLPRFMEHLESVQLIDERRSHWKAKAPTGATVEWDAEIVDDVPNQLIAWRALPDSDLEHSGEVRFTPAPGGRGTEVHVDLRYTPPGGVLGAKLAKLLSEVPETQIRNDLRRLKQVLEVGEVVRSEASIARGPHPARPPEDVATQPAGAVTQ